MTEYAHGTPSWIELSSKDVDGAKRFYGDLMGWSFDDNEMPGGMVYTMANIDGKAVAGLMAQPQQLADQGMPPMWNHYVTVADVDATATAVTEAGGTVLNPPFDVFDAGRMAVVQDPTGAVCCLWQPKGHPGAELVNEPGAFTWSELATGDQGAAAEFYGRVLGWQAQSMASPDGSNMTMFARDGAPVASARDLPAEGVPPHWGVYFAVADADAAAAAISAGGGQVVAGPFDTPPGRMAAAVDPDGAAFSFIQLNPDFDPTAG